MFNIAIIGSGPTGIYTAHYLLTQKKGLSVTMFEADAQAGKGTPYHPSWNSDAMLANIASIEIPPLSETLVAWLRRQPEMTLARMGLTLADIGERVFYPRVVLGKYFQSQLSQLGEYALQHGSTLTIKPSHRVLDVKAVDTGMQLSVQHNEQVQEYFFGHVVMATGHTWPTETEISPGYFSSPWPPTALKTIDQCHVGIRGTSLSAIDALVALAVARGAFLTDEDGVMQYLPEPGTEAFRVTLMSRKGLLPEADFYHPIPYAPLQFCTQAAVDALIGQPEHADLLDRVFLLFKAELAAADPDYAKRVGLADLALEAFCSAYFAQREHCDTFVWAEENLREAMDNYRLEHTVPWRYAILRMHEVIAGVVPHLTADDYLRFRHHFKSIFVDDYATVPHESIRRVLALHRAGKLDIIRLGEHYTLDTGLPEGGARLTCRDTTIHFPAFIEAMGQGELSIHKFPFPSLWQQGLIQKATLPYRDAPGELDIKGIALDRNYRPVTRHIIDGRLYCLSLPFILSLFPFAQGITSSHDMGKAVADDLLGAWGIKKDCTSQPDSRILTPEWQVEGRQYAAN